MRRQQWMVCDSKLRSSAYTSETAEINNLHFKHKGTLLAVAHIQLTSSTSELIKKKKNCNLGRPWNRLMEVGSWHHHPQSCIHFWTQVKKLRLLVFWGVRNRLTEKQQVVGWPFLGAVGVVAEPDAADVLHADGGSDITSILVDEDLVSAAWPPVTSCGTVNH